MNELDRILTESDAPPPSARFTRSVMRAIREAPPADEPLRFPWLWVAGCLLVALVGAPLATLWHQGAVADGGGAVLGRLPWLLAALAASSLSLLLPLQLLRE